MAELEHIAIELAEVKSMLQQLMANKPQVAEPLQPLGEAADKLIVGKRSSKAKQQAMYHLLRTEHYREGKEAFKRGGRWVFDIEACQNRDRTLARKR